LVRSRRALEAAPPEEEEEEPEEEVVAGIRVANAGVPRWIYAFYVLIPLFAFLYVVNNVALRPAAEEQPQETEAPTEPQTEVTLVASGIKFDPELLIFPPETEVTVNFENKDAGVPHNFVVWPDEQTAQTGNTGEANYAGSTFSGVATREEKFTTPGVGEYFFNCTVHPTSMFGTVEVVAG
jgi:plastocyanin